MDELSGRIGRFLFYNPWCTLEIVQQVLGRNEDVLERLSDASRFEKLRVVARHCPQGQDAYALTLEGQRELIGRYRSPTSLSDALLMICSRLEKARRAVAQLALSGLLAWSISPWRPSKRGPYFDALAAVNANGRSILLVALLGPPHPNHFAWYLDMLVSWKKWLNANLYLPGVLIFLNPALDTSARTFLSSRWGKESKNPVLIFDGEDVSKLAHWSRLGDKGKETPPGMTAPAASVLLNPDYYLMDARSTPFKKCYTLRYWAEHGKTEPGGMAAFFLKAQMEGIDILEAIARFPGLSVDTWHALYGKMRRVSEWKPSVDRLIQCGFVIADELDGGSYQLTERGLGMLARMMGVGQKQANHYLGWPVRKDRFQRIRPHQELVVKFMLKLKQERALIAWDHNNARYEFWIVRPSLGTGIRRLEIAPDSAGILSMGQSGYRLFWLEVDRGTRRGKRLEAKLEKYFLAHFAIAGQGKVPSILMVIDTPAKAGGKRLQGILEKLVFLSHKHPSAAVRVLLTTWSRLEQIPVSVLDTSAWFCFTEGHASPERFSLRDGLEKG